MTDDMRLLRTEVLAALLDAAVGFYALNVTFERPGLALDEDVERVLREAIREAANILGRASEPRIVAILAEYARELPENAQKAPKNARKPRKTLKKG